MRKKPDTVISVDLGRKGGDHSAVCVYCKDCCTVIWMATVPGGKSIATLERNALHIGQRHDAECHEKKFRRNGYSYRTKNKGGA